MCKNCKNKKKIKQLREEIDALHGLVAQLQSEVRAHVDHHTPYYYYYPYDGGNFCFPLDVTTSWTNIRGSIS